MPRGEQQYKKLLGTERVVSSFTISGGKVVYFAVQLDYLVNGAWVKVSRIDSCHGTTHRHTFHPKGKEVIYPFYARDLNDGLTLAQKFLTEKAYLLRENYITQKQRGA